MHYKNYITSDGPHLSTANYHMMHTKMMWHKEGFSFNSFEDQRVFYSRIMNPVLKYQFFFFF
jgi:hypothetical protein